MNNETLQVAEMEEVISNLRSTIHCLERQLEELQELHRYEISELNDEIGELKRQL